MKMISAETTGFEKLNELFKRAFHEDIPLDIIPDSETFEGLAEKVYKSIAIRENMLPKFYGRE